MQILSENRILLCCRKGRCPIVEKVSETEYTITDDYEGKVVITAEELGILKNAIDHFLAPPETK